MARNKSKKRKKHLISKENRMKDAERTRKNWQVIKKIESNP